jgi:hypothetical protein
MENSEQHQDQQGTEPPADTQQNGNQRPVERVKSGKVIGSIRRREGKHGYFFTTTFDVPYDAEGETKYTREITQSDLANLASAAIKADMLIDQLKRGLDR